MNKASKNMNEAIGSKLLAVRWERRLFLFIFKTSLFFLK
jgi:hypothetical protein